MPNIYANTVKQITLTIELLSLTFQNAVLRVSPSPFSAGDKVTLSSEKQGALTAVALLYSPLLCQLVQLVVASYSLLSPNTTREEAKGGKKQFIPLDWNGALFLFV